MAKMIPSSEQPKYPVIVEGEGPVPSPFMVIGEAPGRTEIADGRPFVGKSGELLRQTLKEYDYYGHNPELWCYITNAFKGDVGEGNRNPTKEELDDHQGILMAEIESVNPSGILVLGSVAVRRFLPNTARMADVVGRRMVVEGQQLYPCYHPAYILRSWNKLEDFRFAVARFVLTTEVLSKYEHVLD